MNIKRTKTIKIRVTSLELAIIKKKAGKSGMQVAPFCREKALEHKVARLKTQEELETYDMFSKYHNNFESIKERWRNQDVALAEEIIKTAKEIRIHLEKIKNDW